MAQLSTARALLEYVMSEAYEYDHPQSVLVAHALAFVPQPADKATVAEVYAFGCLMTLWGQDSFQNPLRGRMLVDKLRTHSERAIGLAKILIPERKL